MVLSRCGVQAVVERRGMTAAFDDVAPITIALGHGNAELTAAQVWAASADRALTWFWAMVSATVELWPPSPALVVAILSLVSHVGHTASLGCGMPVPRCVMSDCQSLLCTMYAITHITALECAEVIIEWHCSGASAGSAKLSPLWLHHRIGTHGPSCAHGPNT